MKVFFSHVLEELPKELEFEFQGTFQELVRRIDSSIPGFRAMPGKSYSRVYLNPDVKEEGFLGGEPITDPGRSLTNSDSVLFSFLDPNKVLDLVRFTMAETGVPDVVSPETLQTIQHKGISFSDLKTADALAGIKPRLFVQEGAKVFIEQIPGFVPSSIQLETVVVKNPGKEIVLRRRADGQIARSESEVIYPELLRALCNLFGTTPDKVGLYKFQEDALFSVLEMIKQKSSQKKALLLTMPTGGGKTEAFMIPVLTYVLEQKYKSKLAGTTGRNTVKCIIMYPTKALANDQADRLAEILNVVNKTLALDMRITFGVFTGDTPSYAADLDKRDIFLQVCPHCREASVRYDEKRRCATCTHCGETIEYVRLTRSDMTFHPPDILITNPDSINANIQNPRDWALFASPVDFIVFDEIHQLEGIFGCNVAHLLRRFESLTGRKPVYIGLSATIGNPEEQAALLFNLSIDEIAYLRAGKEYLLPLQKGADRYRVHMALQPASQLLGYYKTVACTINLANMLTHSLSDIHARKTLVFTNFRKDTDKIAQLFVEQEERYFQRFQDQIADKLAVGTPISDYFERKIVAQVGWWHSFVSRCDMLYPGPVDIGWHRGGLEPKSRLKTLTLLKETDKYFDTRGPSESISKERPLDLVVATKTLELGIDIGDITGVMNSSAPFTSNEYIQRVGRGGRTKDSYAITIVNPEVPLDEYFYDNFESEYADPDRRRPEPIPIIVSNEYIFRSHVCARILDYASRTLSRTSHVGALITLRLLDSGQPLAQMRESKEEFAAKVMEETLNLDEINKWFALEAKILGIEAPVQYDRETVLGWIISRLNDIEGLHAKGDPSKPLNMDFTTAGLVPKMRSSGEMVELKMVRIAGKEAETVATESRSKAIRRYCKGAYYSIGIHSYQISDVTRSDEHEGTLQRHLLEEPGARAFFNKRFKLPDLMPVDDNAFLRKLIGPDRLKLFSAKDYTLSFFPTKFYCKNCGQTYPTLERLQGLLRCRKCGQEVRQVREIYRCRFGGSYDDKGNNMEAPCGKIFEPIVPAICPDPSCPAHNKYIQAGKKNFWEFYRFNSWPKLAWQCRECEAIFDFHDKRPFARPRGLELVWNTPYEQRTEAQKIANDAYNNPEARAQGPSPIWRAHGNVHNWQLIGVENLPPLQVDLHTYIRSDPRVLMGRRLYKGRLQLTVGNVTAISLANQYSRRLFSEMSPEERKRRAASGESREELNRRLPLPVPSPISSLDELWGDFYKTHALRLRFEGEVLRALLPQLCKKTCYDCLSPERRQVIRKDMDSLAQKEYCFLHSLKHAIINAAPRYTGITRNEFSGYVKPNDTTEPEIIIMDSIEGGSGAMILLGRHWDRVWQLTKNLIQSRETLFLEMGCQSWNRDLCPRQEILRSYLAAVEQSDDS
jgi:ATP-dependent helicase YprA (DUF1998 family)